MNSDPKERGNAGRSEEENEWKGEHERRKRTWSERDRKERKERRHPGARELDGTPELPVPGGFIL